jgi:hypothetical protein
LRDIAQPFVGAFNEVIQKLDDQLPNAGATQVVDLELGLKVGPSPELFESAQDAYGRRFFDNNHALKTGDVVAERFQIARGGKKLGTFRRAAIADNLANNIFRQDDSYWSEDSRGWEPLGQLLL